MNKGSKKIAQKQIKSLKKTILLFFVIFLCWAMFLPISSAVIADGVVVIDFNRKTIQHLEGGIIAKILVKEGDFVEKDQDLLYLHDIEAKSDRDSVLVKLQTLKLQKERLIAEKNNNNFIVKEGVNIQKLDEASITQRQLFQARTEKKKGRILVLQEKLTELRSVLKSLKWQKEVAVKKVFLTKGHLEKIRPLAKSEDLSLTEELEIEKEYIDAKGEELGLSSKISETKHKIAQAKLEILNYNSDNLVEILDQIEETESEIAILRNDLSKTEDVLTRSAIKSPVAGLVMDIKYHTIGAVIQGGSSIMSIVPEEKNLIVEARVRPQDIDSVHQNMLSKVLLTAYKDKKVPKLQGRVINVSGDALIDEKSGQSYYLARIKIAQKELKKLRSDIKITPGMPAQVFVVTGSRVMLDYLFSPIRDSAYKAFREE